MKRISITLLLIGATCAGINVWAQKAKTKSVKPVNTSPFIEKKDTIVKKPKAYYVPVYLGNSNRQGGGISKFVFDSLLKQGIRAKDSLGRAYQVESFDFSYAERNMYEDEVGNLMWVTDYLNELCLGDTISRNVAASIYMRTKPGDTTYFDNIRLRRVSDNLPFQGKAMRFEITK